MKDKDMRDDQKLILDLDGNVTVMHYIPPFPVEIYVIETEDGGCGLNVECALSVAQAILKDRGISTIEQCETIRSELEHERLKS